MRLLGFIRYLAADGINLSVAAGLRDLAEVQVQRYQSTARAIVRTSTPWVSFKRN
jgi:hypothetical protein